jgi:hypothetical protein
MFFEQLRRENLALANYYNFICRCDCNQKIQRGVRVVEGARLESVYTRKGIEGSNPFLSATSLTCIMFPYHTVPLYRKDL